MQAALSAIRHRGPDGWGSETIHIGSGEVWLGHTRLSILDLSDAGRQPMRSRDGRWWVSYNGEIYNHLELRKKMNIAWRGHSDTETLVESLAANGIDATLQLLNGIFAFAALDVVSGKLYIARDPFGVKPMYYAATYGGGLAFCSELRALHRIANAATSVDPQALRAFLTLRFVPSPSTLIQGIGRVPPGHVLEHELATKRNVLHCYVSPPQERFAGTFEEAVDGYYDLLSQAVKRQLLSDVPVGIFLSGGIDSAIVAALAARHHGRLPSYTVGFGAEHKSCELMDAEATAKVLGLEHYPVQVTPHQMWDAFEECIAAIEEPLATPSVLAMWHLARRAREDVTVVLSGQGTDEPWGGYLRYQAELWRARVPFPVGMGWIRPLLHHVPRIPDVFERVVAALPIADRVQRFTEIYAPFSAALRGMITGSPDPGCAVSSIRYWLDWLGDQPMQDVQAMMAIDARLGLADNFLLYGDKIAMAHSIEARVPMLDVELVRFVESLPLAYRLSLGRAKIAHKQAAARHLTAEIVRRPKRPFHVPFAAWSRTFWKHRLRDLLLDPPAAAWTWFRREGVQCLLEEHLCGRRERSVQVFALASLFLWLRQSGAR